MNVEFQSSRIIIMTWNTTITVIIKKLVPTHNLQKVTFVAIHVELSHNLKSEFVGKGLQVVVVVIPVSPWVVCSPKER